MNITICKRFSFRRRRSWNGIKTGSLIAQGTRRHDSVHGPANIRGAIPSEDTGGVAAIDLVNQAAQVIQSIEDQAAETKMRAHDLARRAAEQLNFAERRIRALESAQSAAEASLNEANARADQAEQGTRIAQAQIAAIEDRLCTAEDRARNAEARAIEAEKTSHSGRRSDPESVACETATIDGHFGGRSMILGTTTSGLS